MRHFFLIFQILPLSHMSICELLSVKNDMRYRVSNITPGLYLCACGPTPDSEVMSQVAALLNGANSEEARASSSRKKVTAPGAEVQLSSSDDLDWFGWLIDWLSFGGRFADDYSLKMQWTVFSLSLFRLGIEIWTVLQSVGLGFLGVCFCSCCCFRVGQPVCFWFEFCFCYLFRMIFLFHTSHFCLTLLVCSFLPG